MIPFKKQCLIGQKFNKLDHGITAKKHEIKATRAEHLPKIVLDSALDINVDNKNYLEPDVIDFRLSVVAEIPLFDGLRTLAKVNQRKHELQKLYNTKTELKNGVTLQVIEAVLSLEEARKTLLDTEEAVNAASENQSLARQSFELEIIESKKVIDAQVLEAKVKAQRLLAIFNYNVAKANLKKVMGVIDAISQSDSFEIKDLDFNTPSNDNNNKDLLNDRPEAIL